MNRPKVETKPEAGFGRNLLEKGLTYELDGKVDLHFESDGVKCQRELPID